LEERLKKRLIGAAVLASLAVIFVPMLVEKRTTPSPEILSLPQPPSERPEPQGMFEPPLLQTEVPRPKPLAPREPVPDPEEAALAAPSPVAEPPPTTPEAAPAVVERPSPPISAWIVRVGSFSSRENAVRLVEKLREAGLDTMDPQPVDIRGRTLYRVQVGPEADRKRAERLLPRIRELTRLDGQVRSYP